MNVHLGEVMKDIQGAFGQRDVHGVFGADINGCARFRQHYEVITRYRALIPNRVILYLTSQTKQKTVEQQQHHIFSQASKYTSAQTCTIYTHISYKYLDSKFPSASPVIDSLYEGLPNGMRLVKIVHLKKQKYQEGNDTTYDCHATFLLDQRFIS